MSQLTLVQPQFITNAKKGINIIGNVLVKQSPIILAGTAIIGVGTTGYLAYKAGLQVDKVLEKAKEEKGEDLTVQEKVQSSWKLWIPPIASGALTVGAIVASTAISEKRRAALAGLYAISETALKEYQDKTKELYGEKKERNIRDSVNADLVKNDTPPFIPDSPMGKVWIKDRMSNRLWFKDLEKVRCAVNDMNAAILAGDMCWSLNEFYESIDEEACDLGMMCGWNLTHLERPYFTSALTSDMHPILVLDWENDGGPVVDYRDI